MTITNDTITFEPADIAQLSVELQTGLDAYASPRPVEVVLSRVINDVFNRALAIRVNRRVAALKGAVADATPEKKQAVEELLTQAEVVLFPKEIIVDKPEEPAILSKL